MKKSIVILFFLILANLFWAGNYIFDNGFKSHIGGVYGNTFESSHLLAPLFSGISPFVISMQARVEFI